MIEDIISVKEAVKQVLSEDERARNDDKWLIIQVLQKMDFKIYIPFDKLDDMPSFESITRCRRKYQEQGEYLAVEEVKTARAGEEQQMKRIDDFF